MAMRSHMFKKKGLNPKERSQVKRIISSGREKKHAFLSVSAAVTSTALVQCLTSVSQANTDQTRGGDRLKPNYLQIGSLLYRNTGGTAGAVDQVRVVVFQWKEQISVVNFELLSELDIIEGSHNSRGVYPTDDKQRYTVLSDKVYVLGDKSNEPKQFHINIGSKKMRQIQYNAGTTTATNHIGILYVGRQVAGVDASNLELYSKFNFTDS